MTTRRQAAPVTPGERMASWVSALVEVSNEWSKAAKEAARRGAEPPWLDWETEGPLVAEVRAAAICADAAAVKVAAGKWRQAWIELLAVHHAALGVRERAREIVDEAEGRPRNASVHRMFDRHGARAAAPQLEMQPPAPERRPDAGGEQPSASMENQMRASTYFSGTYLKAADLQRPVNATIERVVEELVGGDGEPKEKKLIVYFRSATKGVVLNRTNFDFLVSMTGTDETAAWIGQVVNVWNDLSVTFNNTRGGIRFRAPVQAAAAPAQHAPPRPAPVPQEQPPPPAQATDWAPPESEIPF